MATTEDIRLTGIKNIKEKERTPVSLAANGKTVHGAYVTVKDDGFAIGTGTIDVAGGSCAGIAFESLDNTGGSNGDIKTFAEYGHTVPRKLHGSLTVADVGRTVYVYDNETVCDEATSTGKIIGGILRSFGSGVGDVQIAPLAQGGVGPTGATGPTGPTGPTGGA